MFELLITYKYPVIFLAMLLGGDTVLIPVIHLAVNEHLDISLILAIGLVTSAASDSAYYLLGRLFHKERVLGWPFFRGRKSEIERLSRAFEGRSLWLLFLSKFIIGTSGITKVLCGIHRVPYRAFLAVDVLGFFAWMLLLAGIGVFVDTGLSMFADTIYSFQIALALFVALVVITSLAARKYLWNRWSR